MYVTPTLKELSEKARLAFRTNLKGSDAWVWPNNVYVAAKVMAGLMFEMFGFASYVSRQKFAVTAPDIESLRLHGAEFGLPQKPAAPAQGVVRFTATSAISVDANSILRRSDGVEYRTLSAGSLLSAGTLDLTAIATTDGATTSALPGTPLQIVSGLTGDALAEVGSNGIAGGADVEDIEAYRARILFRKRNPPHGGSAADYVIWALEVSGVSRVFVERLWNGGSTVRVFPLMEGLYQNGIAPPAEISRVADHIDVRKPAGAIVTVSAPTSVPVNITISGLSPDTLAVREAVLAELSEMFARKSVVAGVDSPHGGMPYLAVPTSFSRSWVWQAVANAVGEDRHTITSPAEDVALAPGEIATLGVVTFSS